MGNAASCCGCEYEWHSFISIVRYKKRVIEGWRGREWTGVLPSNEAGGSDISPILDGRDGVWVSPAMYATPRVVTGIRETVLRCQKEHSRFTIPLRSSH